MRSFTLILLSLLAATLILVIRSAGPERAEEPERGESERVARLGSAPGAAEEGEEIPRPEKEERAGETTSGVESLAGDSSGLMAELLASRGEISDPADRPVLMEELRRAEAVRAEETAARAREAGLPLVSESGAALAGFDGEVPLYDISHNAEAAISIVADRVRQTAPFNVDGWEHKIGLWDVLYAPSGDHYELDERIEIKDNSPEGGQHATHVAATMIGSGSNPLAKGMSPQAMLYAHSSDNMLSELAAVAGVGDDDFSNLYVSVHPYGEAAGWENNGTEWYGVFSNDGNPANDYAPLFGQYSSTTASWDALVRSYPYHLMVKSASNHADDEPPMALENGQSLPLSAGAGAVPEGGTLVDMSHEETSSSSGSRWSLNGTATSYDYDPEQHPEADGQQTGYDVTPRGFGTVDSRGSAKNVLTVGSVSDAVVAAARNTMVATLNGFSSAGPTDDGRIKPDLVANGDSLYSADGNGRDAYIAMSGTSMAAASAGGAALLLVDLQKDLAGRALRASTLKGLLIHSADDLGNPGPDYRFGWGLLNLEVAADLLVDQALGSGKRLVESAVSNSQRTEYFMVMHDGNGPIRATLCWTDPAGAWTSGHDNRSRRLVHDLNLSVTGPDGTVHRPYVMPYASSFSKGDLDAPATTGVNGVDNVERVELASSAPGLYRFEVSCAGTLVEGTQDYSLLVSGTMLGASGVTVVSPVADTSFVALTLNPVNGLANVNQVFSGSGHSYGVQVSPAGIATVAIDASGNVNLIPTGQSYGRVTVTLTADDASSGHAEEEFVVNVISPIIRVDANTPAAPADQHGGSWSNAFRHLRDALATAVSGSEIWVADGVYYPDQANGINTDDSNDAFVIGSGRAVYGGFAGTESARGERDPAVNLSILSGDIDQDDLQRPIASYVTSQAGDWNNSYRVVRLGGSVKATLDGVVVTAGRASGSVYPTNAGAGVFVNDATAHLENCLISGNNANIFGGGLDTFKARLDVVRCRFVGNRSGSAGGAVNLDKSTVTFSHCEFRGNYAPDGGAIWYYKDALTLTHCLFTGNSGSFGGGALHVSQGEYLIENSSFAGNYTMGQGGAIRVVKGGLLQTTIRNSVIWNNRGGGSIGAPAASIFVSALAERPVISNSVVDNSGGSLLWNTAMGIDGGANLDLDPLFVTTPQPAASPSAGGDLSLREGSSAIDRAPEASLGTDRFDLDRDGDAAERIPVDLAGAPRIAGGSLDLGAYEFGDPALLDSDEDGMSDAFEQAHGGPGGNLDPQSDLDGDGLSAMAEFLHGLDPSEAQDRPVTEMGATQYAGANYLTMTFEIDPDALNFVSFTVERRGDLLSPLGWSGTQAIQIGSVPSPNNPALLLVTYRSQVPFGQEGMEFMRVRHERRGVAP